MFVPSINLQIWRVMISLLGVTSSKEFDFNLVVTDRNVIEDDSIQNDNLMSTVVKMSKSNSDTTIKVIPACWRKIVLKNE